MPIVQEREVNTITSYQDGNTEHNEKDNLLTTGKSGTGKSVVHAKSSNADKPG